MINLDHIQICNSRIQFLIICLQPFLRIYLFIVLILETVSMIEIIDSTFPMIPITPMVLLALMFPTGLIPPVISMVFNVSNVIND